MKRQRDGWFGRGAGDTARPIATPFSVPLALTAAEAVLIAGLGFALALAVWTIVTPVGPLGAWQPRADDGRPVADMTVLGSFDPFFRTASGDGIAHVSDLGLVLLGTRVDTVSGRGSAIIAVGDQQSSFLVGEEIVPGVRLKSVQFDDVTLDRGGVAESLFLDQSSGAAPVTPDDGDADPRPPLDLPTAVPASGPAAAPARLAAEVAASPRLNGSEITGYVLNPQGTGTAFAAAGLRAGDVVVSVDGAPVGSILDPARLTEKLGAGGAMVEVERGGQRMQLRLGANR